MTTSAPATNRLDSFHLGLGNGVRAHASWLALACLGGGLLLAATAAARKSVTVDEFAILPHGLAIVRTGDFHLDPGIPPLASILPGLALAATSAQLDTSQFAEWKSTWECGGHFMEANRAHYHQDFLYGRAVSLAVLLLTGLLAFGFARSLYGATGGLVTAIFVSFCPNLLAHGPLITPDIYLTAAMIGALWAFDGLLRRPGWMTGLALGVAFGAASLAKFTGLFLFVIFPLLLLVFQLADRRRRPPRAPAVSWGCIWLAAGGAAFMGLLVINLGYLFSGSFARLDRFPFTTRPFQLVQQALPGFLPMPLPYPFVKAMDTQLAEAGYSAYLLGEFNATGFRHYYLVGLLVKTPIPVLLLWVLAFLLGRRIQRREIPLLVTAWLLVVFFSLSRHKNIGIRYILFLEPIMAIWLGRLTTLPAWSAPWHRSRLAWGTLLSAAFVMATALVMWPDYLAYFNWISGGPSEGHKILLDSNLDWGQDLTTLREYLAQEGIESVDLAYFGRVDPKVYGVSFHHLGMDDPPGRYVAISANLLWGRMYFINGTGYWPPDQDTYAGFRRLKPKAVLGHTIYIYDRMNLKALPPGA
jgi:hypothetical protein